jgi:membrane-bound lytic murein transglycosylase D
MVALAAVVVSAGCVRTSNATASPAPAAAPAPTPAPAPPIARQASPLILPPALVAAKASDTIRIKPIEVTRRAAEVFGDTAIVTAATAMDSGPSWDIDVRSYEATARVEHYVQQFSGRAKERVESWLERGTRYEPMIRTKLREGGLPEDMYYLALIESGFDQNAYSRAAAVGMWQFMTSTARDMGMRVDWWIDERRDPFRSTTAAVRFIKGLNEQFGSLYLAAAAYNGGPGRVARGLTRYADALEGTTGDDLFFALAEKDYFRNETREYVPQLIAAALIAKEPARYGMKIDPLEPLTYDSVRVGPATPMAAIAHAADVGVSAVLELNPHVLRGITPPKDSFYVRLPVGKADSFAAAFAGLPKSERLGVRMVMSKKGESFSSIGQREGLNARQLSLYNPKLKVLKSGKLAPGQSMLVPTPAVAAAALTVPDPSIERYSSSRSAAMHVVKSGETLSGIAKKYHTSTAALMKANSLRRPLIFPGQSLVVGGKNGGKVERSKGGKPNVATKAKPTSKPKSRVATKSK